MATDDYGQGVQILDYTDRPDLALLGKNLAAGLTPRSVMRFANASARDATITSPVPGMVAWVADTKLLTCWDGAAWRGMYMGSTDWSALTLNSGFTTPQGSLHTIEFRVVNAAGTPRVEFHGSVDCTADVTGQVNVATLPVGARPTSLRTLAVTRTFNAVTSGVARVEITTAGVLSVFGAAGDAVTSWFCMDGCSFDI